MAARTPTAVQRVHTHVKERVFSGEFADGTMLSENAIATELGVSRTPVREAFVQLETQGFLRLYPKRGALVVPMSREDLDAVIETRWVVERYGIERAVATAVGPASSGVNSPVVAGMQAVCDEQRRLLDAGDLDGFADIDREFHRVPVAATGNDILIALYDSLRDRQRRMVRGMVHGERAVAETVLGEHLAILAAVRDGKASKALRLLEAHLGSARAGVGGA